MLLVVGLDVAPEVKIDSPSSRQIRSTRVWFTRHPLRAHDNRWKQIISAYFFG